MLGPTWVEVRRGNKSPARPQDVLTFYFQRQKAAKSGELRPVQEVKVMLVGRGGAGKTSLRRFFLGQPHNPGETETPGIALDAFKLTCQQSEVKVRLWDFAGQEITHALHQFFLTEGCIYLLVLDPRSNTEMLDAEYWLRLLKQYAGKSPVLLALNRQDARQGGYDVDRSRLREQFPCIHSFTRTNCSNREGCEELKAHLQAAVASLGKTEPPHLKVPLTWLNVMQECAGMSSETPLREQARRQYMTLEEFREICARHGEPDEQKQESLARLLHGLGVVLHFVDEERLRDTSVLDPHWVTDGVYRLLRFKDRPDSDGILTLEDALEALPGETERKARFLLHLMERFEMCFPLEKEGNTAPQGKWLIPGALDPFQPEHLPGDWQQSDGVRLRYVYDPLPEGVMPRFIVRTHLLSESLPRWRYGVVLEGAGARALVRQGSNRNHVEVTAIGSDDERLRLLEIIQGNFESIHADLPDPKPFDEMELAGQPGVFRRVEDLEAAERRKQPFAPPRRSPPSSSTATSLDFAQPPPAIPQCGTIEVNPKLPKHQFSRATTAPPPTPENGSEPADSAEPSA